MTRRVRSLVSIAGGLAVGLAGWVGVGQATAEPGSIFVAVSRNSRPVTGLTAQDFVVQVGGQDTPVLSAAPSTEPLALIIFVQTRPDDTSLTRAAIRNVLSRVRAANPEARVGIANGPGTPLLYAVTAQAGLLERQIGGLYTEPDLGNVVERLPDLTRRLAQEPTTRRVLLAITSPGLTHGQQVTPETGPMLEKSGVELWGIQVAKLGGDVIDRDLVYARLIEASGGREATVYGAETLDGAAKDMTDLFLSQYQVTYRRPDAKGTLVLRIGVRGQPSGTQVFAPAWTLVQ